jgi:hypothetical protein
MKTKAMKPSFILMTVAAGLLLAATSNLWAMPPRQHAINGVVESIDCASRTITLKAKEGAVPLTFVWNESTRFTRKGDCAKCGFDFGQTIRVSYRREVGQNVLREVSTKGASAACGAACCVETNPPSTGQHDHKVQ